MNTRKNGVRPKISIIIPIYNSARYIEECLTSVLQQEFQQFEIICVDDGSTDSSLEIVKRYQEQEKRIRIYRQLHLGTSKARNLGLREAAGEYIYYLDSDDKISNDMLHRVYQEMEQDNLDILLFDGSTFYENEVLGQKYAKYKNYYSRNKVYSTVKSGKELYVEQCRNKDYKVSCCLQVTRREFLNQNQIRFFEGIMYEDNLYTLECMLNAKKVKHISEFLFYRRVRENSTLTRGIASINVESYYECVKEITRIYQIEKDRNTDNEVLATLLSQLWTFTKALDEAYIELSNEERKKTKEYLLKHYKKTIFEIAAVKEAQAERLLEDIEEIQP